VNESGRFVDISRGAAVWRWRKDLQFRVARITSLLWLGPCTAYDAATLSIEGRDPGLESPEQFENDDHQDEKNNG
jgi:hypothetical protein